MSKTLLTAKGLDLLSPVDKIFNVVEKYFYYSEQIKNLERQQKQISLEAELCHHRINAQLELEKERLLIQQKRLVQTMSVIEGEFKKKHIEKDELRHKLVQLIDKSNEPNLNTEERHAALESMNKCYELLMIMEQNSHQSLLALIEKNSNCLLENHSNVPFLEKK